MVLETPPVPLAIATKGFLLSARLGDHYTYTLEASGGTPGYTWAQTVGELPPGLSLSGHTISGWPAAPVGDYHFGLSVTDGAAATQTAGYTIHVATDITSLPVSSVRRLSNRRRPGRWTSW